LLHHASRLGYHNCVKVLLNAGADVSYIEKASGHTALDLTTSKKCKKSLQKAMRKSLPPE
jgi:hypothetical protein